MAKISRKRRSINNNIHFQGVRQSNMTQKRIGDRWPEMKCATALTLTFKKNPREKEMIDNGRTDEGPLYKKTRNMYVFPRGRCFEDDGTLVRIHCRHSLFSMWDYFIDESYQIKTKKKKNVYINSLSEHLKKISLRIFDGLKSGRILNLRT